MLTSFEKKICESKLQFLASTMVAGMINGYCNELNREQKTYILSALLNKLCISLNLVREEIINYVPTTGFPT